MNYALYTDLASWWPLLSDRENWALQADLYRSLMDQALGRTADTILELGSGGGLLSSHFGDNREVVLTDISPQMLDLCRANNPERTHIQGDMRDLRIDRRFDAVLLHDAVMYITSPDALLRVFQTAAAHLKPEGVFLILPDVVKENFEEMTCSGGTIGQPGAQLLEWHWDPDPSDHTYQVDMTLLLKDASGQVQSVHEQHQLALFDSQTYVLTLRKAGFAMVDDLIWDEHLTPEVFCGRLTSPN